MGRSAAYLASTFARSVNSQVKRVQARGNDYDKKDGGEGQSKNS